METRYTLKNKCMVNFMPPYYSVVIDACVMSVCGSIQKGIIFTFYSLNEDITVLKRLEKRAGRSQRKKITEGSSMKIVVLDGYTENPGDLSWDSLAALGELIVYDRTPADIILQRIGDADAVYTNKKIGRASCRERV
jgi:hypothetical protein